MDIFVDSRGHCHTENIDGAFREVNNSFFDGKCAIFIKGHCYEDANGYVAIYPWKPGNELVTAQAQYELDMAEAAAAYQEGVNSAYDQ